MFILVVPEFQGVEAVVGRELEGAKVTVLETVVAVQEEAAVAVQ